VYLEKDGGDEEEERQSVKILAHEDVGNGGPQELELFDQRQAAAECAHPEDAHEYPHLLAKDEAQRPVDVTRCG
jgi:hypothetical protein